MRKVRITTTQLLVSCLQRKPRPFVLLFFCPKNETKKELRYMKKTYVSPLMVEVNVEAESMLATSLKMDGNKTVDTSNGGQLGKENDRQWGNLWN